MSSGHNPRNGRANRRARRDGQRQRTPDSTLLPPRPNGAMLVSSALDEPIDELDADDDADDTNTALADAGEVRIKGAHAVTAEISVDEPQPPRGAHSGDHPNPPSPPSGSPPHHHGAPHEYAPPPPPPGRPAPRGPVPYAPGMRIHQAPPPPPEARTRQQPSGPAERAREVSDESAHVPEDGADGGTPLTWPARNANGEQLDRGDRQPLRPAVRGEVGPLIESLKSLFEKDRATASQSNSTRCGLCYLHFTIAELEYRDAEGYYVCANCAHGLGSQQLPMVRKQQRV